MNKGDIIRLQFDVPRERLDEIEILMKKTGITIRRELFNNALTFFEWYIKEVEKGNKIISIDEDKKKYKEVVMPSIRIQKMVKG